jgi:hypothetical protein
MASFTDGRCSRHERLTGQSTRLGASLSGATDGECDKRPHEQALADDRRNDRTEEGRAREEVMRKDVEFKTQDG